jgi:hypothetical protein
LLLAVAVVVKFNQPPQVAVAVQEVLELHLDCLFLLERH